MVRYTILLTPDNNHFHELQEFERCGLIVKHSRSTATHPVYVASRVLMQRDYSAELLELFQDSFLKFDPLDRNILSTVYRHNKFSRERLISAKNTAFTLWSEQGGGEGIHAFDEYYRNIRRAFNRLQARGFLERGPGTHGYLLTRLDPLDPQASAIS